MRVCKCPKCGEVIVDNPLWRPSGFKWGVDFCDYSDFCEMHPCLAEHLKPGGWVEDELYIYRRSKKSNRVYRMAKMEYTRESFMLHGLTDSATHKNPYPKNYHYELLRKRGKKLDEFAGNLNEQEIIR